MSFRWKILFLLLTFSQVGFGFAFAFETFLEGKTLVLCQKNHPYCDACTGYAIDKYPSSSDIFKLRPIWYGTRQQHSSLIQGQQQGESFQDYERRLYPDQDLNEVSSRVYCLKDNVLFINKEPYEIDIINQEAKLKKIVW